MITEKEAQQLVKRAVAIKRKIEDLKSRYDDILMELENYCNQQNINKVGIGGWEYVINEYKYEEVDPYKLHELVGTEVMLGCVKVLLGKVREQVKEYESAVVKRWTERRGMIRKAKKKKAKNKKEG